MKIKKYLFGNNIKYPGLTDLSLNLDFSYTPLKLPTFQLPTPQILPPIMPLFSGELGKKLIKDLTKGANSSTTTKLSGGTNEITAIGLGMLGDQLGGMFSNNIFGDSDLGRNIGTIFSQGLSAAGNTMSSNLLKGTSLTLGLSQNVGSAVSGTVAGVTGDLIGRGINSLGGNSMLSRGIGQGVATGIGAIGGSILSGGSLANTISKIGAIPKAVKSAKAALDTAKTPGEIAKAQNAVKSLKGLKALNFTDWANIGGLAGNVVGSGLQAAFGPSKEYGGKYGGITQGMDMAYDTISAAAGMFGPVGSIVSGGMALNKGLSNIFGSTSGMTVQDAVLGSAFMPAPVKWLNMWGANTTGSFKNQSWLNTEKTNSFMGNAFGDLSKKFDTAREEAGKTYGTFSRGAYNDAQNNIDFANRAWNKILAMADLDEYLNIRSQYMSSINNLRYAQNIQGGWNPIYRGKQGMKILNNATNHNMGMRLLSAAALIDNKQMILCSAVD